MLTKTLREENKKLDNLLTKLAKEIVNRIIEGDIDNGMIWIIETRDTRFD